MNKKLKLQDFTFLINIIKDQDNWNIQDLADKLTVDLDTLLYMLNIMSEVYSVNGESFINFDLDLSKNNITFDYSIELKDLETITDFELFKQYYHLKVRSQRAVSLYAESVKKQRPPA